MRRALLLVLAAMLLLSGCSMLETEYLSISDYSESYGETESEELYGAISSYSGLRSTINRMVQRHEDSGKLSFRDYVGDINNDIALAVQEIVSDTALGAYAVDYVAYDLNRIVSYYEAEIFINYKRSQEETESIITLSSESQLYKHLCSALAKLQPALTVRMTSVGLDDAQIRESCREIFLGEPLTAIMEPSVGVDIYPKNGFDRIIEISFDYSEDAQTLREMKSRLFERILELSSSANGISKLEIASALAQALADNCSPAEEGADAVCSTAYGAAVNGSADSRGMALGFMAMCVAKNIDCIVVEGQLDKEPHYWNIVTYAGMSRHIDLTSIGGDSPVIGLSDLEIPERYWWDTDKYPVCEDIRPAYSETEDGERA